MSQKSIGTCSKCGGAVCIPTIWAGVSPPTPACVSCGAVPKEPHGKTIEMQESDKSPQFLVE